jgi:hypothetical protein
MWRYASIKIILKLTFRTTDLFYYDRMFGIPKTKRRSPIVCIIYLIELYMILLSLNLNLMICLIKYIVRKQVVIFIKNQFLIVYFSIRCSWSIIVLKWILLPLIIILILTILGAAFTMGYFISYLRIVLQIIYVVRRVYLHVIHFYNDFCTQTLQCNVYCLS